MTITVDRAGLWDAEALADVAAVTFPLACPPHASKEDIEAFIDDVLSAERFSEYLTDPARTVLKATSNGEIVGYVMLVDGAPEDDAVQSAVSLHPATEISKLYVLPGSHGTGVSAALMDAAVEHARSSNCAGVWLGVNQENERAQRFYIKNGFERVGTKTFKVGAQTHRDFVMQRSL
ncbi:GNAT family N-acetyltransferase [Rhodococcus sp. ABRD24]|uniref:GNAT family N-acetyltransferase n=1 Tax=Rhodococcus sp. ABRD24 TaxID=2507582 RepID=UPI00103EFDAB|nr:GNAT family N-acetyltransferase [Rhodococcus sp. ABRD24]QBJ98298.1 GNAT family N-acetyltransferase [Rhodococcus sp. ABRD24]